MNDEKRRPFTCTIPERIYRALRIKAAEEGTTTGKALNTILETVFPPADEETVGEKTAD